MNWSEEKRIGLIHMSHVIKMIDTISPDRFSNLTSYINKVVKANKVHVSYVPRIHIDNIMNIFFTVIFYLTIFCVNDDIDDMPSSLYISFCSIKFMFIIIII